MIRPGIFVIATNSAHSNEILEVDALIEGNRFVDTVFQRSWNKEDFRVADDYEVVGSFLKKMFLPKYEWSLFPVWVNWAYIQPNKNLVLSSHRPNGFTVDYGFFFSNLDNSYQQLYLYSRLKLMRLLLLK